MSLTGGGIDRFANLVQCVKRVEELLGRDFREGELDKWTPSDTYGCISIDISNRYLTPIRDCSCQQELPIDKSIDPRGHLKAAAGSQFGYIQENEVQYFELLVDSANKQK